MREPFFYFFFISFLFFSQIYTRFSPTFLDDLLKKAESQSLTGSDLYSTLMGVEWDNLHEKLALPHQMRLILGDVSEGSNTPKMVSKVLQWKRENEAESTGNFFL
jgi:phosphomevalonate kinase